MSHYLARLVARTRGTPPIVRPATTAVTAPDAAGVYWDAELHASPSQLVADRASRPDAPRAPAADPRPQTSRFDARSATRSPLAASPPAPLANFALESLAGEHEAPAGRNVLRASGPASAPQARHDASSPAATVHRAAVAPTTRAGTAETLSLEVDTPRPDSPLAPLLPSSPSTRHDVTTPRRDLRAVHTNAAPDGEGLATRRDTPPLATLALDNSLLDTSPPDSSRRDAAIDVRLPSPANARSSRELDRSQTRASQLDRPAAALVHHDTTTIEVSIGRIEVRIPGARAVASAPGPAPARRPSLDLAEYLRRRDREGR